MASTIVSKTASSAAAARSHGANPNAGAVVRAFHQVSASLFTGSNSGLASQLKAFRILDSSGAANKGSVTFAYRVADGDTARAVARSLKGAWSNEDESPIGDNVGMPDGTMLRLPGGFSAKADGKDVVLKLRWVPAT